MDHFSKMTLKRAAELGREHGRTGKPKDCLSLTTLKLQFAYMEGYNSVRQGKIMFLIYLTPMLLVGFATWYGISFKVEPLLNPVVILFVMALLPLLIKGVQNYKLKKIDEDPETAEHDRQVREIIAEADTSYQKQPD